MLLKIQTILIKCKSIMVKKVARKCWMISKIAEPHMLKKACKKSSFHSVLKKLSSSSTADIQKIARTTNYLDQNKLKWNGLEKIKDHQSHSIHLLNRILKSKR